MSRFKGEFEISDTIYWWKSRINKQPAGTRYAVYDVYGTLDEPEPKEIDCCDLVLFYVGSRDGMVNKLRVESATI